MAEDETLLVVLLAATAALALAAAGGLAVGRLRRENEALRAELEALR